MVPQTEAHLKIDPHQRAIWGHSYGGLFVLDAWRKTSLFHLYYSASPSLGQAQESPLKGSEALSATAFIGNRCICWKVMAKLPGNRPATWLP
ncbi:IroE protein-like protein [Klebsiella variicola]|uniref:IroE protein-like protein n=1 Tax=Klebsiella variicola TaxID=244366 RepID=A0A7H4MK25_KLEVA|nr:IroE protein-like protein [Klebsiella variicola]